MLDMLNRTGWVSLVLIMAASCAREPAPASKTAGASTLRVVVYSGVYTLDPHRRNETTTLAVLENMFESLIWQDSDLKVVPGLAANWESPDDLTWRVHLRPDVKFHDGSALTSEDVKYSYERVLTSSQSDFRNFLNSVQGIQIVDSDTVDIKLRRPYAFLANLGTIPILPSGYIRTNGEEYFLEHPVGTGPYRFVSWKPGVAVKMEAFDDYWRGKPSFKWMEVQSVAEPEERLSRLASGAADISWMIPLLREPPVNFRVLLQPALHVTYLAFDFRKRRSPHVDAPVNPFSDVRVRKAFQLGIDTNALIDKVLKGRGYTASQYVTPSIFGFNPAIKAPAVDREAARRLLAEAGYPNGFSFTVDLQPDRQAIGAFLQSECRRFGIDMRVNVVSKDVFYEKMEREDVSAFVLSWACASGDASELFEDSLHTYSPEQRLGSQNYCGFSNPTADAIFERSLVTGASKERLELLQQAMALVVEDVPWIPLYIGESAYGVSKSISYEPRLDDHILGYDARPGGS